MCNMDELLYNRIPTLEFEAFSSKRQIVCLFFFFHVFVLQNASSYEVLVRHVPHVHHN